MSPGTARILSRTLFALALVMIAALGIVHFTSVDRFEPGQIVVVPAAVEPEIEAAAASLEPTQPEGCVQQEGSEGRVSEGRLGDAPFVYCDLRERQAEGDDLAPDAASPVDFVVIAVALLWFATGGLISSRQPRNQAGWLFQVVAFFSLLDMLALELVFKGTRVDPGSVPLIGVWAIVGEYSLLAIAVLPMLWLLFPDGRPPTPRWRWGVRLYFGAVALAIVSFALSPGPLNNFVDYGIIYMNPVGVPALAPIALGLTAVGIIGAMVIAVASVFGVRSKFKRAEGEERQRLRWLRFVTTIAGALLVLTFAGGALLDSITPGRSDSALVSSWFNILIGSLGATIAFGLPGAYLIAIFKHGLWDLDLVIKKAVVALVLTLLMAGAGVAVLLIPGQVAFYRGASPRVAVLVGMMLGLLFVPLLKLARGIAGRIAYGKRATEYEVLTTFGERVGGAYSTDVVLPRMAQLLASGTGATSARVLLRVGSELREEARWPSNETATGVEQVVPVLDRGEELGALATTMPASDPMNSAKEKLIADLAAQAGLVLRNVKLIEELKASRQRLVAAQDEERRKIERNIHDGAQQQLVALSVQQRLAASLVGKDDEKLREMLGQLQTRTNEALEDLRDLARGIYPPLLADKGLGAALESQARKAAVPTTVNSEGVGRYHQNVESAVYFCTLEALNNIAKYAQATSARISLARHDGVLTFDVTDDGKGFDTSTTNYGTGLQGMADRLDAIGGTLHIESRADQGTRVRGSVPIDEASTA